MTDVGIDPVEQTVSHPTAVESLRDQYLTARDGVSLREEAVTVKGRARTWGDVRDEFESYVWRQRKASSTWEDEKNVSPNSHRFTEQASKDRYGRTLGVDRAARDLWGNDLTTVFITRRARAFGENGQPQPPADHLDDLLDGNHNVYRAYERHIEDVHGLTYARLSVLEPHANGYAHIHDALWVKDPDAVLSDVDILPAVDAHLDAVEQARPRNHGPAAVDVRHDPEGRDRENRETALVGDGVPESTALPPELCKYLGGMAEYDGSSNANIPRVLQADTGPLRFYALLWARGIRQWRPDQSEFPRFVGISQYWYDDDSGSDDVEETVAPEDIENGGGVDRVDVEGRPTDFEKYNAGGAMD
ncbi:hypothetical protein [Halapricum desulfuricans]|uniref:Replication protein n=1 Tax=Halapricum desulfuricans TaxID=2841257 RepID=A0A897NEJ0_9EURY|nr:hypothetical protein [Halapricum desulfuricans]QSG09349.1 hypothetical protein HSR122_1964 [Halapricum desulfuricans]